jgi:hypothetical protein
MAAALALCSSVAVQLGYAAPAAAGGSGTASASGQGHGASTPGSPTTPGTANHGTTHQGWGPGINPSSTMTAGGNGIGPIVNPSTNSGAGSIYPH